MPLRWFLVFILLIISKDAASGSDMESETDGSPELDFQETMIIEPPRVSHEELLNAATKLHSYEFDEFAEMIGFPKSDIEMGGFSGISQYGVAMFRGIKYGVAERFEMPSMVMKPEGIVDAKYSGPSCPQPSLDFYNNGYRYSEDCLFLDVYVPLHRSIILSPAEMSGSGSGSGDGISIEGSSEESGSGDTMESNELDEEEKMNYYHGLPIIIVFQGEEFSYVESKHHDGRVIAKHGKAIVVIINYRTGALGFLSSGNEKITGNFGLYDQRVAIMWVKKYAENFGGDPSEITLIGFSSGAESVSAQMYNSMDDGNLFRRVVLQSGISKQGSLFYNDRRAEREAQQHIFQEIARIAECGSWDAEACIREMDVMKLVEVAGTIAFSRKDNRTFGPIADEHYLNNLEDCTHLSKYEIMIGVVKEEAAKWVGGIPTNATLNDIIKHLFASNSHFHCVPERVVHSLEFEYRDHTEVEAAKAIQDSFLKLVSDYKYIVPAVTFANRAVTAGAKTYFYQFDAHVPAMDPARPAFLNGQATHGDDQVYLFGIPLVLSSLYSSSARNISANYLRMITNFAHTGDPDEGPNMKSPGIPAWKPYTAKYMGIYHVTECMEMKYRLFARNVAIWTEKITYLMSDEVCSDIEKIPVTTNLCSYQTDWEKNYKQWRDVDIPRWREAAEKNEMLAAKLENLASCDEIDSSP